MPTERDTRVSQRWPVALKRQAEAAAKAELRGLTAITIEAVMQWLRRRKAAGLLGMGGE